MSKLMKTIVQIPVNAGALRFIPLIVLVYIALAGCATTDPRQQATATEDVLESAGFQLRSADTPEKLAHLKTLPQRQIFTHKDKEGKVHWLYADASYCECLYVGTEETYQEFKRLVRLSNVTQEQSFTTAVTEAPADEAWDMWGMWRNHWAEP